MKYAKPGAYVHGERPPRTIVGHELSCRVIKRRTLRRDGVAVKTEPERWMIAVRGVKAFEVRRFHAGLRMMPLDATPGKSWRTDGYSVRTIMEAKKLARELYQLPV